MESGSEILERLGLEGDVTVLVYKSREEVPEPFDEYFESGQTTIVEPGGGRILVVEENWRLRGRDSWPSLLAQALAEALVPPPEVPEWAPDSETRFLAYKALRNYQVHTLLASRGVREAVGDARRVLGWVLKEISLFSPSSLEKVSRNLLLVVAIAAAAAWPYRSLDPDLASRLEQLIGSLPSRWSRRLWEGLESGLRGFERALRDICLGSYPGSTGEVMAR